MRVRIFWMQVSRTSRSTTVDGLSRACLPHACIWPGDTGELKDIERSMLEREGDDVLDAVKKIALFAVWYGDVTREAFCNDDFNAAK